MSSEQEAEQKLQPLWPSVMVMGVLFVLAGFAYFFLTQATPEFYHLGVYQALFIAMGLSFFLALPTIGLAILLSLLRKKLHFPRWLCGRLFMGLGACAVVIALLLGLLHSRPKDRLMRLTSGCAADADNIRAAGFNAFLASRWVFAFDVTEAEFLAMTKSLKLEVSEDIDLKSLLGSDYGMMGEAEIANEAPGKEAKLKYSITWTKDTFAEWITMAYSASAGRAWLYYGYQN